jgi:hypothetical protein
MKSKLSAALVAAVGLVCAPVGAAADKLCIVRGVVPIAHLIHLKALVRQSLHKSPVRLPSTPTPVLSPAQACRV